MNAHVHPNQGSFFDLSARTKLRISGADRLRYLNGQISNDLRKASETNAIHACVLTAKGKINADVFIHQEGESLLIDSDPDMREQLAARLERYVIADDVVIEDVTEQFALFHSLGSGSGDGVYADRYGMGGIDLWLTNSEHEAMTQRLRATAPFCDAECEEVFRIERGVPRWGRELSEEIIPTEANLESSAIDYAKGCYIGQEVISRIKMSGQTNKRLSGFITTSTDPLQMGMHLWTEGAEAKDVGWITSATLSGRLGSQIALGFLKRGFQEIGTPLVARAAASNSEIPVQITALPFI